MTTLKQLHLAIIPDGNRRWAASRKFNPWKGHKQAIENFRSLTQWCRNDPRISILTVWCFSTENWKRDPKEIKMLMKMLEDYLIEEQKKFIEKETRFLHSGRKDRIPFSLAKLIEETEQLTKNQTEFTLNLAVDYGGKDEILRAIDKMFVPAAESHGYRLQRVNQQTPAGHSSKSDGWSKPVNDMLRPFLDHPSLPDIDLVIRTSGEMRTSNFFLWQSAYAEWMFSQKLFPDFTVNDLAEAVKEYERRGRRYGT